MISYSLLLLLALIVSPVFSASDIVFLRGSQNTEDLIYSHNGKLGHFITETEFVSDIDIEAYPNGQTLNICGDLPPTGWITIAVSSNYCGSIGSFSYIGRTIKRIDGSASGTVVDICGDGPPTGWVTTVMKSSYCATVGMTNFYGRTIKKYDGLPTGTSIDICGDSPPPGWITTVVKSQYCAAVGFTYFYGRTILKIAD
jgi:hypothetical protein